MTNGMKRVDVGGIRLNYIRSGQGVPMIWGHALMDSIEVESVLDWFGWDELNRICDVIRYDTRGHGGSDTSSELMDYHWSNLARDMLCLADFLDVGPFIASGRSMGCATAIYAALHDPKRIPALILVNPPTGWSTREVQARQFEKLARVISSTNAALLSAMIKKKPENQYPDWLVEAERVKIFDYIDRIWSQGANRLETQFKGAAICDLPLEQELRRLNIPTLILAWDKDSSHPLETAEQLHSCLKGSMLMIARDYLSFRKWPKIIRNFIKSL